MHAAVRLIAPAAAVLALSACAKPGDLVVNQGVGVTAVRSLCPAVGIPDYTGDITTFSSPTSRLARDMDVEATMTNLRTTCDEQGERIYANATFDVYATRSDTRGARTVELPYFSVVLRGGSSVVTKKVGTVRIAFADGQDRAVGQGQAGAFINRADATLPMCASGLHASARRATKTPRSTRWPIPRCAQQFRRPVSNCWSASSCPTSSWPTTPPARA